MKEGTVTWSQLPSGRERYVLESVLAGAGGVFGVTWCARDQQAGGARVAVKLLPYSGSPADQPLHDEYAILRDFTAHANIQQFYGVFCERAPAADTVWLVLELCEGGTAAELARRLLARERKLTEDHHAFIIKEVIKGTSYLHENKVVHRNICGSSILLTREGEVKLGEFGVSRQLSGEHGKRRTSIGSPGWMAPEVVCAATGSSEYGSRADVWALGITAIELADGKAPFQDMHPTRALFQIVRNPPPSLDRPSSWSNDLNDFIAECLEKNPEHRPFMVELLEHPCIQAVPENDYHLTQELKKLIKDLEDTKFSTERVRHTIIKNGHLLTEGRLECESLQVEDLAALDELSEDTILQELKNKLYKGFFTSYIGDILLILSPIIDEDFDSKSYHKRYECKSLADNAPHIFGVADAAYQRALHHGDPQHLVFCGESGSGKSTQALHALSHLLYLGRHTARNNTAHRVSRAAGVIRTAITAATPANPHSTRCIFQAQLTYGTSGKLSGAIFWVYQLERWRISSTDMSHGNFNLVYYFYDSMEAQNMLEKYNLESGRNHRYLRVQEEACRGAAGARDTASENAKAYGELLESLTILDWEPDDIVTLENILAAILVLGNVRFKESKEGYAEIENAEQASRAARLLLLEEAKFRWALLNYCVVERGAALKRRRGSDEARDARDALAAALYKRLVDFILHNINSKLAFGRSVFGDKYSISILDMFGFECFHRNRLEQLIVNTTNEQMQFLYNQRTFAWEMQEQREEQVPPVSLHFYDNKCAVDQLMGRPLGLFHLLDEASRTSGGLDSIMSTIKNSCKGPYIKLTGSHEFSVAHFAGKVKYDAREMADRNKDFLPPEMIETMRASGCPALQALFRAKLTRSGNLVCTSFSSAAPTTARAATKKLNAVSCGQYSQLHRMRTTAATYRATSLELLKQLAVSPGSGGTHFVKCVRAHLAAPLPAAAAREHFHAELVRHQMRALSILDTAKARQKGFSSRIPFPEFIRRYKFLAFDFDETVEESKDNCRLLLIRLKMEGWLLGSTKVFLKYYNEEFLGRLYERQVKKIVKVQCMMRAFLARRKAIKSKSKMQHVKELKKQHSATANEDEAALLIQKAYRGYVVRKAYGPLVSKTTEEIDEETAGFLKRFALKWKSRSIFQVLLQYRAQRYQDLVHFSQQVHIYNQCAVEAAVGASGTVPLEHVQPHALALDFLGAPPPAVRKLPFRIDQLCYHDTTHMCSDPHATRYDSDQENWDEPLKRRLSAGAWSGSMSSAPTLPVQDKTTSTVQTLACQSLIHLPFCRDPMQPITTLTPAEESPIKKTSGGTGRVELASRPPPVYKKKQPTAATGNYQPPTPWSGESKPARSAVIADDIPSPIKELQALAKASADLNPSGEAPFNFQAMLKRTPRNRASMKRSGESDDCVMEDRCAPPQPSKATSNRKPPAPTPTPVKRPAPVPPAAGKQLASAPAPHPHTRLAGPDNKRQPRKVQLVPGISVEGEITDL